MSLCADRPRFVLRGNEGLLFIPATLTYKGSKLFLSQDTKEKIEKIVEAHIFDLEIEYSRSLQPQKMICRIYLPFGSSEITEIVVNPKEELHSKDQSRQIQITQHLADSLLLMKIVQNTQDPNPFDKASYSILVQLINKEILKKLLLPASACI